MHAGGLCVIVTVTSLQFRNHGAGFSSAGVPACHVAGAGRDACTTERDDSGFIVPKLLRILAYPRKSGHRVHVLKSDRKLYEEIEAAVKAKLNEDKE